MEQKSIVTLTMNPAVDISTSVAKVETNTKLRCDPPSRHPGGGGINVSRGIRKLGGFSLALFLLGGKSGEFIADFLQNEGVKISPQKIDGDIRENITVYEENSGEQYRFGMPGPALREIEWKEILERLESMCGNAQYLVASGSLPLNVPVDFYARVARIAHKTNTSYILDTSGEALEAAAKEEVFLIKPNRKELGHITGEKNAHEKDLKGLKSLALEITETKQIGSIVVSLGREGAMLVTKDGISIVPAPDVKTRSKIGAGDSMTAGIVLSLAGGKELEKAFRYGIAAGSAAVMTPGTELCRRKDADRLYEEMIKQEAG